MPKSKKKTTKKTPMKNKSKQRSTCPTIHQAKLNHEAYRQMTQDPIYVALRKGVQHIVSGLKIDEPADYNLTMKINEQKFGVIYSKHMFVENRDFIGHTFYADGKYYVASWLEALHPQTVRGGFWVIAEFAECPSEEQMKLFIFRGMATAIPALRELDKDFFEPLDRYNARLLGLDNMTDERWKEINQMNASFFDDLRFHGVWS